MNGKSCIFRREAVFFSAESTSLLTLLGSDIFLHIFCTTVDLSTFELSRLTLTLTLERFYFVSVNE